MPLHPLFYEINAGKAIYIPLGSLIREKYTQLEVDFTCFQKKIREKNETLSAGLFVIKYHP